MNYLPPVSSSRPLIWDGRKFLPADTHSRLAFRANHDLLSVTAGGPNFLFSAAGTGAAWATQTVGANNAVGIARMTGGSAADVSLDAPTDSCVLLGQGYAYFAARVSIPTLSNGTNRYAVNAGFRDAAVADAVMFRYVDNENSGRWQARVYNNTSSILNADTGITVAAATWYLLEVYVSADGTRAAYCINGDVTNMVTANIPRTAGRELGYGVRGTRTLGAGTINMMDVDYLDIAYYFSTAR